MGLSMWLLHFELEKTNERPSFSFNTFVNSNRVNILYIKYKVKLKTRTIAANKIA